MTDKIYHVSDIHIRNYIRHKEYNSVFDRLYQFIKADKTENSIIIVTGDIVHAKTDMSPEATRMQSRFYRNLAEICPTILIAGNHDCNLNNKKRLDAIQPVVDSLDHPNLMYWRDNGIYEYGGISYSVMSVFSEIDEYIMADSFEADYKIALFHGAVNAAMTEIGYEISSNSLTTTLFNGFDLALLGDIHMPNQSLNGEGTIKYPGSLIQQNHGEDQHHGILVWDVKTKKSTFHEIENDYGYYTIRISHGLIANPNWKDEIPKKVRLRLIHDNTTKFQLKNIIIDIKSVCTIIEKTQQDVKKYNIVMNDGDVISYANILDPNYQNSLIEKYLKSTATDGFEFSTELLSKIFELNRKINKQLDLVNRPIGVMWKPIHFEFSNMFSYGENNVIDFTKLNNLIGVFAPNASGKSSLLDAIVFCLFDKCSRTGRASSVLNTEKKWFHCKFEFEMNGTHYFVERNAELKRDSGNYKHVKLDVQFWSINAEGVKEDLNGDARDGTNKQIRSLIGTYEDFITTAMKLQTHDLEFVDSSQRDRKDLLYRLSGIDIFEKMHELSKKESQQTQAQIKLLTRTKFEDVVSNSNDSLNLLNSRFDKLTTLKVDINKELDSTNASKIEYASKLHSISGELDIDILTKNIEGIDSDITIVKEESAKLKDNIGLKTMEMTTLQDEVDSDDMTQLNDNYGKYKGLLVDLTEMKNIRRELEFKMEDAKATIDKLANYEYDPECDYCNMNPFVVDANQKKIKYDAFILEFSDINSRINACNDIINKDDSKNLYNSAKLRVSNLKSINGIIRESKLKYESLNLKLDSLMKSREMNVSKLKLANKNKKSIEENKEINKEIILLDLRKSGLVDKLQRVDDEILKIGNERTIQNKALSDAKASILQLKELQETYSAYEYYSLAMKRDSLPYVLIQDMLPSLEKTINDMLIHMVDYAVKLEADGKNINAYIDYGDGRKWSIELSSGMERFIASLAIRVSLVKSSNLPRPNFMWIDEGFGVLDSDNLGSLYRMFTYLNSQFDFVLCISHINTMRDMVDNLIEVNKIDGFSKVMHR